MSAGVPWPAKYPWRLLPLGGPHPYLPLQRGDWLQNPPRGPQGGYVDRNGNEWVPHAAANGREEDFHWDVEHPNGMHTNVRPDGELHHGQDNF